MTDPTPDGPQRVEGLLERLRAATGPDRGADWQIAVEMEGWAAHFDSTDYTAIGEGLAGHGLPPDMWLLTDGPFKCRCYTDTNFDEPPEYTASLDDALALVERCLPKSSVALAIHPTEAHASVGVDHTGFAPTAPLAVLIALLSALTHRSQDQ